MRTEDEIREDLFADPANNAALVSERSLLSSPKKKPKELPITYAFDIKESYNDDLIGAPDPVPPKPAQPASDPPASDPKSQPASDPPSTKNKVEPKSD